MNIIPSIFPSSNPRLGNLVIGAYPHKMTASDAAKFKTEDRKHFLVVEMQDSTMLIRACQDSFKQAMRYMGTNRWIVFPVDYTGDSSMIYY